MLRAIAAIAREEGEDLADPRTGLACLEVFALGASAPNREVPESDYFAVRDLLARGAVEVADFALDKGVVREGAPAVVRFLAQIASRFGIVVSQKVMAQAVVVVGAVGGAALNLAFAEHFQDLAARPFHGPQARARLRRRRRARRIRPTQIRARCRKRPHPPPPGL